MSHTQQRFNQHAIDALGRLDESDRARIIQALAPEGSASVFNDHADLARLIEDASASASVHDRLDPAILALFEDLGRKPCGEPDTAPGQGALHVLNFGEPVGHWPRGNLKIAISTAGCLLGNAQAILTQAFNVFPPVQSFFFFTFVGPGAAADINVRFAPQGTGQLSQERGGALGQGSPSNGLTLLADQGLGLRSTGAAPFVWTAALLLSVAMHEAGHVLGLGHSTNKNSLMYPFVAPLAAPDPETVSALRTMYGWAPQRRLDDRASTDGPAITVTSMPNFTSANEHGWMAWKGSRGDNAIWWAESTDGIGWGAQNPVPGVGTSAAPSLAPWPIPGQQSGGVMLAWKGSGDDQGIFTATHDGFHGWSGQSLVGGVGTSVSPALAQFQGRMVMAWKGVEGDSGIYWSTLDPGGWRGQQQIAGRGTSHAPTLCAAWGRLFMFWKGVRDDSRMFFAELIDPGNGIWGPQQTVGWVDAGNLASGQNRIDVGTGGRPAAAVRGNQIFLMWKGARDDQGLYLSLMEQDTTFSGQVLMAGIGSASGPALGSIAGGRITAAWRGVSDDRNLYTSNLG